MQEPIIDEAQKFDAQQQADEMGEFLEDMNRVIEMPVQEEKFYLVNREARRRQAKRDRALNKRNPRG